MKEMVSKFISSKNLVINDFLIKVGIRKELSLGEFLVLSYFVNSFSNSFEVESISSFLGMPVNETMENFNSLMVKGLVSLESVKDSDKRINEVVKLDGFYNEVLSLVMKNEKKEKKEDIFKVFEQELGRTMSSMELEIINGWLIHGTPEEIILGALREAIYNGVRHFRYIDKIIYEWEKKGFKTMDDVDAYMKNRHNEQSKDKTISKREQEISDYDWLDE